MSYAGVYGPDETCSHNRYWRSCSLCCQIGPRATDAQIKNSLERRRQEVAAAEEAERIRGQMYTDLSYREKLVADAFWKRFLAAYPGLGQLKIDDAVKGRASSWVVGRSRGICQNAKLAVVALDNL